MVKKSKNINKNSTGFKRLPRAICCSLQGFSAAWKYESGFRQYLVLSCLLLPVSFFVAQTTVHWLILLGSLVFLLFSEIVNSAIEAVGDVADPQYNELIGRAKDLGSAGVFLALALAIIVWGTGMYEYATTLQHE